MNDVSLALRAWARRWAITLVIGVLAAAALYRCVL
jgi:hypothetical protein